MDNNKEKQEVRAIETEIVNRKFITATAFEKWLRGKGFKINKIRTKEEKEQAAMKYAAIPEEGPNELNGDKCRGFEAGINWMEDANTIPEG